MQALRVHPKAAFHIWLPTANLQIRLTTSVEILTGDAVETEWAKVPPISRISYGTEPEPGTPIRDVLAMKNHRTRLVLQSCNVGWIRSTRLNLPNAIDAQNSNVQMIGAALGWHRDAPRSHIQITQFCPSNEFSLGRSPWNEWLALKNWSLQASTVSVVPRPVLCWRKATQHVIAEQV